MKSSVYIHRVHTVLYSLYFKLQTLWISYCSTYLRLSLSISHSGVHRTSVTTGSQCRLLTQSLLMSNFLTNEATTSRKSPLDVRRRARMLLHTACRPCRGIFAPQTSMWLLSLFAMLAEQSLSWFDDNPNWATPAFPYSEAPNLPD